MSKADCDNQLAAFNRLITWNKTKHLEVQKKLNSLITKDYNFFLSRSYITSNHGSRNMFVYEPTFKVLELKSDKCTEYIINWKSKGACKSKLKALNDAFWHNVKNFGNQRWIQFNNTSLVIEQNKYTSRIVNVYIVYDLNNQPKILLKTFTLKNCLCEATNIVKNNNKEKYFYSGYGIPFDGIESWSFNNSLLEML